MPDPGAARYRPMHEIDVVIIGAGAAGVAAARQLLAAQIPAVVLEARPRLDDARAVRDGARSRLRLAAFGGRERVGRAGPGARAPCRPDPAALGRAAPHHRVSLRRAG